MRDDLEHAWQPFSALLVAWCCFGLCLYLSSKVIKQHAQHVACFGCLPDQGAAQQQKHVSRR
jgi:hypothetical protein